MKHLFLYEHFETNANRYYDITDIDALTEALSEYYGDLTDTAADPTCQAIANNAITRINTYLKFNKIHILWNNDTEGLPMRDGAEAIGMYIHSTATNSQPVFVLFEASIQKECKGNPRSLRTAIEETIYHELIHAMVDIDNAYIFKEDDDLLAFDDEEEYVEQIGRDFFDGHDLPDEIIKLADLFHQKQWFDINDAYETSW